MAIDREKVQSAAQKYVEKKKYDKAIAEYQKIIQEDPNDARTLLKIGDLQSKMEAFADAVATYERVGKFYATQGFALKAIAVYKQIREIIAKHVPQLEERYAHITPKLAELYVQLGLTSDALAALDEVATRMQRAGRDGEAVEVFRKIVELDPTNPLPHLRLAEALSRNKEVEGAVSEFAMAASQLVKLGRRDDALKVIERLLHHKQDAPHARIAAELYLARNQPNDGLQALAKLQICFQQNPKDLDTLALLARAFNAIGQAAKAIEVQKEIARTAKEQNKHEVFKQVMEKLVRLAPNDEGVRALLQGESLQRPPTNPQAMPPAPPSSREMPKPPPPRAGGFAQAPARPAPPPPPPPPPREEVYEYEESVETAEIDGDDEQPFEMRPSNRPPPRAPARDEFDDVEQVSLTGAEVVVDEHVDAAEEVSVDLGSVSGADGRTQLARVLAESAELRRAGFFAKAVETLRVGVRIAPRSIELRETLRDVLLEAGQQHEALVEMINLASLQIDALDGDGAAQTLQDVLALDPHNARAADMLRELGYELVEEQEPIEPDRYEAELPPMRQPYPSSSYDPEAPLPSYDLEEIGPEDVAPHYSDPAIRAASVAPAAARDAAGRIDEIDDPFGMGGDAPLPSFPLDAPAVESEASFDLVAPNAARFGDLPTDDPFAADTDLRTDHAQPMMPTPPPAMPGSQTTEAAVPAQAGGPPSAELEEALEEADFFASRGLFDDARTILQEHLDRLPNHPLILERLAELEAQEATMAGGSGTRAMPGTNRATNRPTNRPAEDDRAFDIAQTLGELEGTGDRSSGVGNAGGFGGDKQVDVEEVFAKFKEGVAKQISVDDAQSHYDLGVAYKEMGLVDDAIREFETAARDPKRECICHSMIGMIQLERGSLNEAIDAFSRGINSAIKTPEQETALAYELGEAYETKKMTKQALEYFQRCARRDPSFRDVQETIRKLQGGAKAPVRAAAVGADDEFDRAFDDIIGGGKLP